jgi:hypothetical protein
LLAEAGRTKEALLALTWALIADEFPRDAAEAWIAAAKKAGKPDGAWLVDAELAARRGVDPPPPVGDVKRALGAVFAYRDALDGASKAAAAEGAPIAARALLSDASRLSAWIGRPASPESARTESRPATAPSPYFVDPPAEPLVVGGFVEDDLSGYEERRAKGLWYDTLKAI